jgi:uroporphyrin-III C-methyltransferase
LSLLASICQQFADSVRFKQQTIFEANYIYIHVCIINVCIYVWSLMPQCSGKVYLVGAGPGDPGLLTLKGKTLLECADVVVYDALISPQILALINPHAEQINAGKRRGRHSLMQDETTQLLIDKAQTHAVIVRLKGGDPFVFGRGGEEMADLVKAGIPVEVIPGITSGIAAPAYAGIPLTHRAYSSSVTFVTGHESAGKYRPSVNWQAIAHASETIVIYMGIHNLPHIIDQLLLAGLPPDTPIALVRWGTRPEQDELIGTLTTIMQQIQATGFDAPAIAVIGSVVNLHAILADCKPSI